MVRAAVSALLLLLVLAVAVSGCQRAEPEGVPHVRLGMAPRDVRERFEPGGQGAWQSSVGGAADDTALEWKALDVSSKTKSARFEFHLGMLVAIRATTKEPGPSEERITSTPSSVTVRRRVPEGGTSVAVLSRDCPTHKDEAAALLRASQQAALQK